MDSPLFLCSHRGTGAVGWASGHSTICRVDLWLFPSLKCWWREDWLDAEDGADLRDAVSQWLQRLLGAALCRSSSIPSWGGLWSKEVPDLTTTGEW